MIGDGTSIPTKLEGTIKEVQGNNVYGGCVVISTDSIDYQIPFIGISSAIETITLAEIGEKIYIAPDNIREAYKSTNILKKKRKRWHV